MCLLLSDPGLSILAPHTELSASSGFNPTLTARQLCGTKMLISAACRSHQASWIQLFFFSRLIAPARTKITPTTSQSTPTDYQGPFLRLFCRDDLES